MGHKSTRTVHKDRKDYTALLEELQQEQRQKTLDEPSAPILPDNAPAHEKKSASLSPLRQRMMSDEQVRFLYAEGAGEQDGFLHDKSCPIARKIPDAALRASKTYRLDKRQCPQCAVKAYVRLGARDFYNFRTYQRLFETMHLHQGHLRQMYVGYGMQTMARSEGLMIWDKEDVWQLEARGRNGETRLLHNNYHMKPDGTRVFTAGFHEQLAHVSAPYAIKTIADYTFEGHKAAMALRRSMAEQTAQPVIPAQDTREAPAAGRWQKLVRWVKRLFSALFRKRP
jgi:hypothetical protein